MKNSNEIIGNRTRDLPTCSAVPQPTAPTRAPVQKLKKHKFLRPSSAVVETIDMLKRRVLTYQLLNIKNKKLRFTGKMQLGESGISEDYYPKQHCLPGFCDGRALCLL